MDVSREQRPRKLVTLVLVHENGRVLLGMKRDGFGGGWWNGFGGKVEAGEMVDQAARRELTEDVGINVERLERAGMLYFDIEGDEKLHECHIFRASGVIGEPTETDEMVTPKWIDVADIPYDSMWKGDDAWMPAFFEGKTIEGILAFNDKYELLSAVVRAKA